MLLRTTLFAVAVALSFVAPISAQNWNSAHNGTWTQVVCTFDTGSYIWEFTNLSGEGNNVPGYDVLAWTLQPFNVPEPQSVEAPAGWVWDDSVFEVAESNRKYTVGGPALEPGETLVFKYTPKIDAPPVNSGGPKNGVIAFTSHLAAVDGTKGAKWEAAEGEHGSTWFETVAFIDTSSNASPEPSGLVLLATGLVSVWGTAARRRKPHSQI